MRQSTAKRKTSRKATCRAAVRRVLGAHDTSAEELLVALVDVIVDSHVDAELRERGLGPEALGVRWKDALNATQAAVYYAEHEFGKGFGRRPARGSVADARAEQRLYFIGDGSQFAAKLSPVQLALRQLLGEGWAASFRFLDRVDPPCPEESEVGNERSDVSEDDRPACPPTSDF